MRRASIVVGVLGVLLLVATALWLLIAPGRLVKYPSDLDKTAVASGQFTLYVDPATGAPRAEPQQLPLSIRRNVRVVQSTDSTATVRERSVEKIGPLPELVLNQQYVMDRSSLENLKDAKAYSYTPADVTNRSPFYAINLPFDAGSGPYEIWKNETGRAYVFRQVGDTVERDGLTLMRMEGSQVNAPAQSAFIDQLRGQGIARRASFSQLSAQLQAQGVDTEQLLDTVLPEATPRQRALIRGLVSRGVPLQYSVTVRTRLLVEPKTGGIVALDRIDQTLNVKPDLRALAPLADILGKPPLSSNRTVKAATAKLTALVQAPPTKVFNITYGQTPASVADFADYTKGKADDITMAKETIPLALGIAGAIALLAAGGLGFAARRRRPTAPPRPPMAPPRTPKEPPVPTG